jgi:tetratricopeptide (TPR) repeat protein
LAASTLEIDTGRESGTNSLTDLVATILFEIPLRLDRKACREAEAALQRGLGLMPGDAQVLAALAICLATGRHKFITAERLAKQAIQTSPYEPWGHYALGRVYLEGLRRYQAFRCFYKARKMAPSDIRLVAALDTLDRRRPPVIPRLPREHRLNVVLGRLRGFLATDRSLLLFSTLGLLVLVWVISLAYR